MVNRAGPETTQFSTLRRQRPERGPAPDAIAVATPESATAPMTIRRRRHSHRVGYSGAMPVRCERRSPADRLVRGRCRIGEGRVTVIPTVVRPSTILPRAVETAAEPPCDGVGGRGRVVADGPACPCRRRAETYLLQCTGLSVASVRQQSCPLFDRPARSPITHLLEYINFQHDSVAPTTHKLYAAIPKRRLVAGRPDPGRGHPNVPVSVSPSLRGPSSGSGRPGCRHSAGRFGYGKHSVGSAARFAACVSERRRTRSGIRTAGLPADHRPGYA